MDIGHLLLSFDGRISRAPYWLMLLGFLVVFSSLGSFVFFSSFSGISIAVFAIVYIAGIYAGCAVGAKRLHDRDKSAWWLIVFYLLPTLFNVPAQQLPAGAGSYILSTAGLILSVWGLVELGFLRGTDGPNQYGPDPLSRS